MELDVKTGSASPASDRQPVHEAGTPAEGKPAAAASGQSGGARSRLRWFSTAGLYATYLGLGMNNAILGPTLQDLAANVNRNISSLSLIFVGRATGSLCGIMITGFLFDHMNQFFLLGVTMVAMAVGLYLVPFCKTVVILIITISFLGMISGVTFTGGNVLILALWGDKGAPHMQALHFSFALGAVLTPLLAKLAWGSTASAQNHTESEFDPLMLNRSSGATSDSLFAVPEDMNLLWAYVSIGTYVLVVSVFLFGLFCKKHSRQKKSTASAQGAQRAKYHRVLLCLLFLFLFFDSGGQVTYSSYIFSFATTHVGMEEAEAAGLNSAFWGTFAACRGLAILFATFLKPGTMIVWSNIGGLVSSFFLVLFDKSPVCLWIATSVYGASMATTFPSGISWIEQYTSISGKSTAFFVIGGTLGYMVHPTIIGILQEYYPDLPVVLYVCLGSVISTAILFSVMYKLATLPLERQHKGKRKGNDQRTLSTRL
ncbi:sodium-dependent glucose transporter 1C [Sigmodon hispidus]